MCGGKKENRKDNSERKRMEQRKITHETIIGYAWFSHIQCEILTIKSMQKSEWDKLNLMAIDRFMVALEQTRGIFSRIISHKYTHYYYNIILILQLKQQQPKLLSFHRPLKLVVERGFCIVKEKEQLFQIVLSYAFPPVFNCHHFLWQSVT